MSVKIFTAKLMIFRPCLIFSRTSAKAKHDLYSLSCVCGMAYVEKIPPGNGISTGTFLISRTPSESAKKFKLE